MLAPGPANRFGIGLLPVMHQGYERVRRHVIDAEKYGDVVRYQLGPIVFHVVRHPDHARHVLQENHANYNKGRGVQKMKLFLGEGLLTSEGDTWKRQRRLVQPAFHMKKLATLADTMVACTTRVVAEWAPLAARGAQIDLAKETMRLTLEIAGRTLFSTDVRHESDVVSRAVTVLLHEVNRRLLFDVPVAIPTPKNLAYKRAVADLDRIVYGIIAERRAGKLPDRADVLSMLLDVRDEETGEGMTDQQLRDEVMTLLLAGHETTANALAWAFHLLSQSPAELRAVEAEVDAVLGGRAPRFEDLPALRRTRMVIDETMRLFPPAWIVGRTAIGADTIGGYAIPARSIVAVSPYLIHRHPDFWSNPEGFDPERFAPEAAAARHKYAYIPFGGGPRICIGNQFALMEAVLVLATIAQRVRLALVPGVRVEPEPLVTLRPRARGRTLGMPMTLSARA